MLELANRTGWQAALFPGWGADSRHQLTAVIKQSYRFDGDGELTPLLPGTPIEPADRFRGDPVHTSLAAAGESMPFKSGGEILLYGTAHPPRGARVMEVEAVLERPGAPAWRKTLRVVGPRQWRKRLLGALPSEPTALTPLPLIYEHAFGGIDRRRRVMEPRNPVGIGFAGGGRVDDGQPLPQIEQGPDFVLRPGQRPHPAGFGPIPPGWEPRFQDTAGLGAASGLCPYPDPVPPGLFNCAPMDQRFSTPFGGGERLVLRGLFPDRPGVRLVLPWEVPRVWCRIAGKTERLTAVCDTLVIDADAGQVHRVWRAARPWSLTDQRRGHLVIDPEAKEQAA